MQCRVVFINPVVVGRGDWFVVDGPTYVGALARNTLRSHGIDCALPVSSSFRRRTLEAVLTEMVARVIRSCRADCLNIIGVTNWASSALVAGVLAHNVRHQCEQLGARVLVVAGGPFFVREDESGSRGGNGQGDSVEAALRWQAADGLRRPYDGVVCGGLSAFVELIRAVASDAATLRDGRIVPRQAPAGYYDLEGEEIRGSGQSARAAVDVPPVCIARRPAGYDAVLMLSSCCPNGCDYCSLGQTHRFTPRQIRAALQDLGSDWKRPGSLKLLDPNPFAETNSRHSAACLEEIRSVLGLAPKVHCYYDPWAFTNPGHLVNELDRFNIQRVFVGREAIGEPGLSFIGRKYRRKVRTASMIDDEKAGVEEVIRKRRESGKPLRLTISYIVSPVETPASLRDILADMHGFLALSGGSVRVHAQWEILWPNPGTAVFRNYRDLISDDPYFAMDANQVWRSEAIAARYPSAVFGRADSAAWAGTSHDANGLLKLVTSVA